MAVVGTAAIVATGLAGGAVAAPLSGSTGGTTAVRSIGTAIESTGVGNAPYTVSGTARFIESYASNNTDVAYKGLIEGVKVYVQWREGAGNADFPYSYSPIYYTTTDEQGNFSIDVKPYFDSIGRVRYFEGRVDVGAAGTKDFAGNDSRLGWREKVRIWAKLPDGSKADYRLINHYASTWAPAQPVADNTVMATWDSGQSSIRDVYINYAKNTDNILAMPDRNDWAVSNEGSNVGNGLNGSVGGTVFWNARVPNGAIDFSTSVIYQNWGDYPISGITIQGSYLSDEAVAAIETYAKATFTGKTLRGKGWTADDENALQAWISEQIKADPTWVAETVTATTGVDGKYQLYFRGIYGNSAASCGIVKEKCHQLADSWSEGSFLNGNLNSKHTNWDWMYVAPVDLPNNVGVMSPWSIQRWQRADGRGTWNGANFGQVGFAVGPTIDSVTLADILLSPAPLEFDVVNYDTQLNPAAPGDTAKTYTGGVLTNENLTYDIVWTDEKGTPVHECTGLRPETNLSLASCDYQVPADLATDTVYTATLYGVNADTNARGEVLASDAFLATRGTELPWGSKYSDYTAEALPQASNGTTLSGLSANGLPDGLSMDPNTGKITGQPTVTGRYVVKVTGDASVPLANGGSADIKLARTYIIVVTDTPLKPGVRGTEYSQEVVPTGFEDSGYTLGEIKSVDNLPAGLTYNADTKTITGTPTVVVAADEQNPNVTVIYAVTRETPGGPETKEVKDVVPFPVITGDSDGDKVPDPVDPDNPQPGEDQCPGTPEGVTVDENGCSAAQLFEPAYADSSVEAGKSATVSPTFTKKDTEGAVDAPEGTTFALGEGAPDWAKIDPNTGEITFTPGADVAAGDVQVPVVVTYPDNGGTDAVNAKVTVTVTDTDGDKVPDGKDQCPGTPAGVTVDTNGCAVAPSIPAVPAVNGVVNTPIDPVVVPVDNPGQATDLVCTATGLADGLEIAYDADKGACVITGTPTAPIDGDYTVTVTGKAPDGDKGKVSESGTGKITVTKPEAPEPGDKDGDKVTDDKDQCPGTPEGVTVDENGCSAAQLFEPAYADSSVEAGKSATVSPTFTKKDTEGAVDAPEGTTFALGEGAPDWAKIDPNTGEITFTPGADVAAGDVQVPVVVTYPDNGGTDAVNAKVTVTVTDTDGDKVPDGKDQCPGTPAGVTVDTNGCAVAPSIPAVPAVNGVVNTPIDPVVVPVDNPGQATDLVCTATGLADGLEIAYDADKGACVITGTPTAPIDGDYTVTVTGKAPDGDKGKVSESGTGKITVTKPEAPEPGDKDGDKVTDDKDQCPGTPEGVTVDENGCSAAQLFEPAYADSSVEAGKSATVSPTFTKKDTEGAVDAPEGTTFALGEGAPDWAKIDPNTGEITFTPGADVAAGDVQVPVVVTYPDNGGTDAVNAKVTVTVTDTDGDKVPDGKDQCPGTPAGVTVDTNGCAVAPSIPAVPAVNGVVNTPIDPVVVPVDNPGQATDLVCTATGLADGLEIAYDADKGACVITGTPTAPIDGDYTVTVTGKAPDGDKGKVSESGTGKITVTKPEAPEPGDKDGDKVTDDKDQCPGTPEGVTVDENGCSAAQLFEPAYADSSVEAGKSATVSPTFTKKDTEGAVDAPEGTTFALGEGAPDWAKIDPNTGEITFTPGADVAAGDVQVPVVVTYPDNGGTDAVNAKVTVTVTDTDGDKVPDGKDQCPGTPAGVTVDTNGCAVAPSIPAVPAVNGVVNTPIDPVVVPVDNPGQATDLVCTATGLADGLEIAYDADKGACVITGTPTAPIDGDYTVTVTGKAPDGDKGKVSESGTGKITVTKPEAPAAPDWGNGSGKPGETVVIPNEGGPVPDGSKVETDGPGKVVIDENGNVVVNVDKDAKPGDKITVTVKDKDGNEIDKIEVTVADPDKQPEADKPNWGDGSVKPGETVVIPNDGGKVPDGAKVTVDGPGKAQIDENGNLVITADPNAKPGDKITVTVTDKDGNVLDTSTITVAGKAAPKSGKLPYTGATVGGLAAAATMLTAAGAFLVSRKRRED